ncbi:glycine/betaine ABC transporter permease [Ureibacillus massiliensis 4400831 = CIP 108448 = CCUG 49529]|uniref:Glycine/betaine ABC transporter permease n=1 Tax=Ureibacillus massiliensis 4400831 = CIP 108448 = CCUG 49529 TaxID=1211035 RepID=A0A0A3J7N0_9BACL|nr:BCCT family transporter [Ureibacillus massiliensis]KGR91750.1 glycine/betaine ABC transporter permease [Ureibacillus massiliensis 4400831 = CIP 108448 = CCUG 49529]RKJ69447.1 BCCT family transporter [Butyricicoccus sp. 1XD8-22]
MLGVYEVKNILKNPVFSVSAIVIAILVAIGAIVPKKFGEVATYVFNLTTTYFSWFYLLTVFIIILFLLFLAISKFGSIRLGGNEARPEFSFITWISMLFSAGLGVGLVFWGVAEPMSHFFTAPTENVEPLTAEGARLAMGYSFFHWGISQWSVYTLMGLVMCYMQFNKKKDLLISTSLEPITGSKKGIKNTIDIFAVIATVMGVATSIGLGVLQTNGGLNAVFGLPVHFGVQIAIIAVMFVGYMLSSTTGLQKGIKILSNVNMGLAILLLAFVFIMGPTVFILESFTLAIGDYITHFVEYSLRLEPYRHGSWVKDWTVFYWAWAIAWSPFVGAFIARVSRGRTIREFIIGVLIVPPVISCFWIATFGGTAIWLDLYKETDIATLVNKDITVALFETLNNLPLATIASIIGIVLIFTFLVTSADSATFIMASMTSKGSMSPTVVTKLTWGVLMAAISAVLLYAGGLDALQTASLIAALPFAIILLLLGITMWKMLKHEIIPIKKSDIKRLKRMREVIEKENNNKQ